MANPRTRTVRISFRSQGKKPPVYFAASFTHPPWSLKELEHKPTSETEGDEFSDEFEFYGTFQVPEGNHQYKFRLGDGDWWVCDESCETVLDEAGNQNNLLLVKSQESFTREKLDRPGPEQKHVHGKPHLSGDASDPNPVWDLIGVDPTKSASRQRCMSPPIHEEDCPLIEHYDPGHPTYVAKAAEACRCNKSLTNKTSGQYREDGLTLDLKTRPRDALNDAKQRPSAIQLPSSKRIATGMREYQFIPAPENIPMFQTSTATSPSIRDGVREQHTGNPKDTTQPEYAEVGLPGLTSVKQEHQPYGKDITSRPEIGEDIALDEERPRNADGESPQRRHLSDADIESVRRSLTHLSPRQARDLVNSAESDQSMSHDRDEHSVAPRFPHEALSSPSGHASQSQPASPQQNPKLSPQAHSRTPTIDMYYDPIMKAFPTGSHSPLSRKAAVANGTERYEDDMEKRMTDQRDSERKNEEMISALRHSPTFPHEVFQDDEQIRHRSTRYSLSYATDGASDLPSSKPVSRVPAGEEIADERTRTYNPRYGSLHESFANVKGIDSFGQEIDGDDDDDDDTTHLLRRQGSANSLTEGLRHRRASGTSFKTACSGGSSCCSFSDGSEYAPKEHMLWERVWQALSGWFASLWAILDRKDKDAGTTEGSNREAVTKHD